MAVFLILVGLSGSLLVFRAELEELTHSEILPRTQGAPLDPATLLERAEALVPEGNIRGIRMEGNQGATLVIVQARRDPHTGRSQPLGYNHLYLDPHTGEELGREQFAQLTKSIGSVMPFIYRFHFNLALGEVGRWILGIVALIWTLDCFVSAYLTLPAPRRKRGDLVDPGCRKTWWQRWRAAWNVRWNGGAFKLNYDLHRAGGLWLWAMLFVFAWSSVGFNLNKQVYVPVMRLFFDMPQGVVPRESQQSELPIMTWRQAQARGEHLMAEQATRMAFHVEKPMTLLLDRNNETYTWGVRSTLDIQDKRGSTLLRFDARNGALMGVELPARQSTGNTITTWLLQLHIANVFGLPYRIFVSVLGLVITMLSVTGIFIWWKKRRARAKQAARLAAETP
jgi:uncharacterized iron-regulated membrane protein